MSEYRDNGELFWIEGTNYSLARPSWLSPERWKALPISWKLDLLYLCMTAMNKLFGGAL